MNVKLEASDVEAGYAEVLATVTRELAGARVEISALRRHINGEEARFAALLEENERAGGGARAGKPERATS